MFDKKKYHREYYRDYNKRTGCMAKPRLKIIELLGNKCANPDCLIVGGCTDIRCLQVDHINGGGTEEMRGKGIYTIWNEYLKGIRDIKLLQVLCANCNVIKRVENKESMRNRKRKD